MPEKNPLEPLLDQISKILQTFDEKKDQKLEGDPTSQDIADLINITSRVEAMKEAFEIAKKEQGITDEEISKAMRENRERLSEKDKQILDRIERMRKEIHMDYELISTSIENERRKKIKGGRMFKKGKHKKSKSQKSLHISFRKGWKKM